MKERRLYLRVGVSTSEKVSSDAVKLANKILSGDDVEMEELL